MQVWTKNILYWFIDSQTHLVCQEVLQWVWPSMNQNRLLFVQIQPLSPSMQPKWKEIFDIVYKATNGKSFANSRKKVPLSRKMVLIHHLFSRNQSLATRSVFMVVCYAMEKGVVPQQICNLCNFYVVFWQTTTQAFRRASRYTTLPKWMMKCDFPTKNAIFL